VIFGGLFTSTLFDTVLTPVLYWLFGRRATERLLEDTDESRETPAGSNAY
jgi:HME family heavy-metal exporter